jgi:fibronectin-binding autotransporter adhesin
VNVVAGVAGTINFNALEWTNIGSINLASGISGANLQLASVADDVDLGIGASVAGTIAASYQDGLFVSMANGGKGGASYEATAGDLTIHLNAAGKSATAIIANTADAVTAGNIVIDGGAAKAGAHVTVNAAGDVTVGDVTLTVGASGTDLVTLGASGDLTVGAVALAAGDSGTAAFTASATGDISIASIAENVGASGSALVSVAASGGDVIVGGVAQVGGFVSATIATSGSGDITVGDVMQTASTSAAALYVHTGVGAITIGDISQTVGDSSTAVASISVTAAATGVTKVADIAVGTVSQVGGDAANVAFDLHGATGTTTSAAAIGGNVTVAGISQTVGDSGSASVSLTAQDGGVVTVGDISQTAGNSADAHVNVSSTSDVTVGDVTISIGDASATTTSSTARFQAQASGDLTVGNVSVSAGNGTNVNAWATLTNATGHDLTVGDVTISVGDQTATDSPFGYFGAFNEHATGDMTIGNVSMNLGLTATGHITISQSNAASSDGGSLTVGDINVSLADKAVLDYIFIENDAAVSTSTSHTTANTLGALTVGDINVAMGTNASASVTIQQIMTGTNGGDVGLVTVGNIDITSDVNATAHVNITVSNTAGGGLDGVEVGNVTFALDDGGAFTFDLEAKDTSGNIDHVTVGNVTIGLGVSGDVSNFTVNVVGGSIGDVTVGDVGVTLGEHAAADTIDMHVSASTGDLGSVTIGNLSTVVGQSGHADGQWLHASAAGDIGTITVGDITSTVGKNASQGGNWVDVSGAGDISAVSVGDLHMSLGQGASISSTALSVAVTAAGDIGSVSIGDATITLAKTADVVNSLMSVNVVAANIDAVTIGNESVTLGATATAGTDTMLVSATGDIGAVTVGNLAYTVGSGATAGAVTRTVKAGGAIDSATFGNVDLHGAVVAAYHMTGTDIGDVTFGNISEIAVTTEVVQNSIHMTSTGALGDVKIGDVHLDVVSGSALLTVTADAATASGNVTLGNITMGVSQTNTTTAAAAVTGGFAEFQLNFNVASLTGDLSVGTITFNGLVGNVLDVELTTGIGGDVHIAGIDVKGTGTFTGGDYVLNVGGADVTIDTVKVEGAAASNNLANILAGVTQTGNLTLHTVDYSNFTGGAAVIDVSAYSGDIAVIGSAAGDTITTNLGSDTLTGGAGTDAFVIAAQSQNLTTLTLFHAGETTTITDFKAGPTFGETIATNANQFDVAHYAEKSAASADAAFTLALSTMSDPTQQSDIVAVQVGADTYVFVDTDGGNNVDEVIKLTGVNTNALNFADFAS